jgi:hypothetical protein
MQLEQAAGFVNNTVILLITDSSLIERLMPMKKRQIPTVRLTGKRAN